MCRAVPAERRGAVCRRAERGVPRGFFFRDGRRKSCLQRLGKGELDLGRQFASARPRPRRGGPNWMLASNLRTGTRTCRLEGRRRKTSNRGELDPPRRVARGAWGSPPRRVAEQLLRLVFGIFLPCFFVLLLKKRGCRTGRPRRKRTSRRTPLLRLLGAHRFGPLGTSWTLGPREPRATSTRLDAPPFPPGASSTAGRPIHKHHPACPDETPETVRPDESPETCRTDPPPLAWTRRNCARTKRHW